MDGVDVTRRYLCLSVDVQGYGSHDDAGQAGIQAELLSLLDTAGSRAGLSRASWIRQPKGDEELSLIPSSEALHRVVGDFLLELDALLRRRNLGREPGDLLRMRLAVDDGPVQIATNGFVGRSVVAVSRLVNSRQLRQALALATEANLVAMVSQGVYRDWIESGRTSARPEWFRRVAVAEKEFAEDAWLWVPGSDVHGLALDAVRPAAAAPAEAALPWPSAHFTGRARELAAAVAALKPTDPPTTPMLCAISGMPGVGKTTLAVRAAWGVASDYPDGCVFIDLHGYTVGSAPDDPAEVLDRILRRLAVPAEQIPAHLDDRVAAMRARLVNRRVLFVLDNVRDVAQVRPVLPSLPGCAAVITSRLRLAALDDATLLSLDVLPEADGAALFRSVARETDSPAALVDRVVANCTGLPLAIRIAAARHRSEPGHSLADLSRRLEDERARLVELDDGHRSVAASLAVSWAALSPEQARLFTGLAEHPPTEFGVHAATALAEAPMSEVRRHLGGLVDRYLLTRPNTDRYQFHDLVGVYARTHARAEWSTSERALAAQRLIDFYLTVTERADRAITPHRRRIAVTVDYPPAALPDVEGSGAAIRWLTEEERTLVQLCRVAAGHGLDRQCWQLSYLLRGYFFLTKRWESWMDTHDIALAAARRLGDAQAEALTLNTAGLAATEQGRRTDASAYYRSALELFESVDDEDGVHTARTNLAWTGFYEGNYEQFVRDLRQTYDYHMRLGAVGNAAIALRGIALGEIQLGDTGSAIDHLRDVRAIFERSGLDLDLAMTLNALGEAYARSGDPTAAAKCHHRAVEVSERCRSTFEAARAHHRLGSLAAELGELRVAREEWLQAQAGYGALRAPEAAAVTELLADAFPDQA